MKKISILIFLLPSLLGMAQKRTFDTTAYVQGGKIWQFITYGNSDSAKINGIMVHFSKAGTETDPVWRADQSQYLPVDDAYAIFQTTITPGTYLTPTGVETIIGKKTFEDGTLVLKSALSGTTTLKTNASGTPESGNEVTIQNGTGILAFTKDFTHIERYPAYSSGNNNVEVMADSLGISATLTSNELIFTIPVGVRLMSAKIRLSTGFTVLKVYMGTNDMGNASAMDRWMPIVQAWREDTGQQLMGLTTTMDNSGTPNFQKFTINGIINTTNNLIRINF